MFGLIDDISEGFDALRKLGGIYGLRGERIRWHEDGEFLSGSYDAVKNGLEVLEMIWLAWHHVAATVVVDPHGLCGRVTEPEPFDANREVDDVGLEFVRFGECGVGLDEWWEHIPAGEEKRSPLTLPCFPMLHPPHNPPHTVPRKPCVPHLTA
jgi:hypothetical protein